MHCLGDDDKRAGFVDLFDMTFILFLLKITWWLQQTDRARPWATNRSKPVREASSEEPEEVEGQIRTENKTEDTKEQVRSKKRETRKQVLSK